MNLSEGLPHGTDLELIVDFSDADGNITSGLIDIHTEGNELNASSVDVLGSASDVLSIGQSSLIKIE